MADQREDLNQIFDICLSRVLTGGETVEDVLADYPRQAGKLRPQLEAALWLGGQKTVFDPRPDFISASRGQLMRQIRHEQSVKTTQSSAVQKGGLIVLLQRFFSSVGTSPQRLAFQFALLLILTVWLVIGGSAVAMVSQNSIPGEPLYPVKIAFEDIELSTARTLSDEIRLHTEFAHRRLLEVQELIEAGQYEHIPDTVEIFENHVDLAVEKLEILAIQEPHVAQEVVTAVHEFIANQVSFMQVLVAAVPGEGKIVLAEALVLAEDSIVAIRRVAVRVDGKIPSLSTRTSTPTFTPTSPAGDDRPPAISSSTPVPTFIATRTPTPTRTSTRESIATPTRTPTQTATYPQLPTSTSTSKPDRTKAPTSTPVPPTNTPIPPTSTPVPPTNTPVPPTNTPVPPTNTPKPPPTNTPKPPTTEPPYP